MLPKCTYPIGCTHVATRQCQACLRRFCWLHCRYAELPRYTSGWRKVLPIAINGPWCAACHLDRLHVKRDMFIFWIIVTGILNIGVGIVWLLNR